MDLTGINIKPTEGQKIAGNYRKGHARVHGMDITIENPAGSFRRGVGADGKPWRSRLPNHYGYIRGTAGADGDHVDVYLGHHLKSPRVYVIDQRDHKSGDFDEHKVFMGFASAKQARSAYVRAFSDGKGEARIAHIAEMDIADFKRWLKDDGARHPVRRRAAGGGVMSDEEVFGAGVPMTDADVFGSQPAAPDAGKVDAGKVDAALRGVRAGAMFNMGDEVQGFRENAPGWVPDLVGPIPAKTIAGAAKTGYGYLTGDKEMTAPYEKGRDEARAADKAAQENHPYIYGGSEIAGAIPAMAAVPATGFAKAIPHAGKVARFGARTLDSMVNAAGYGVAAGVGKGEDIGERALEGASGIVSGIVGGGLGHAGAEAVGAGLQKFGAPVVNTVRGWFNHEGEASKRLAAALARDQEMIGTGKANGLTWQQWVQARQAGEPVTLADLGAGNTQSLLRSAANTSPEGRAMLEQMVEDRFKAQSERLGNTVRGALPGGQANARKTADQLVADYDTGRVPLYRKAYEDGDKEIISPVIERLMGSPTFEAAMKKAITGGKDAAISMEGMGAFNPGIRLDPGGAFVFTKSKPGGGPVYPNLQYWDAVKRQLDDVADTAFRSGAKRQGEVVGNMAKILRSELDKQVPSYRNARGFAEEFFGEKNALEAGRKLAGKKIDPEEVKLMLRKMKPDERELFKEGYASDLAERVIGNLKDTVNVTKGQGMFQTPNERKMAAAIFGPGGMAMLQARMHLETIMDGARQAMGNSTTARQLIEAGLAGGAGGLAGGFSSGWDPASTIGWASGAAGARLGSSKLLPENVKVGAKHLIGKVDAKTARRVAELLTSDDPRLLRQGLQMAAKNQQIMGRLKSIANRLALGAQTSAQGPVSQGFRALQAPARADEEQQRP